MRISTLIPNRNDAATLERAVRSACEQRPPPHEVIVLDDASTDDSLEVVGRLRKEYPCLWCVSHPEKTDDWLRDLMLSARDIASGEYVHFLAADDWLIPGYLASAACCDRGVILTSVHVMNPEMTEFFACVYALPPAGSFKTQALLKWACAPGSLPGGTGALFRRDVCAWMADVELWNIGPWNDSVGIPIACWLFGVDHVPASLCVHVLREHGYGRAQRSAEESEHFAREMYLLADRVEARHGRSPELAQLLAASVAKVGNGAGVSPPDTPAPPMTSTAT